MKTYDPRTKFAIFCNSFIGEIKSAHSIEELLESKMTIRQKKFWSNIRYRDAQNRTIDITREYLEQGMTIEQVVKDYIEYGNIEEEIMCLNPRGSGTVTI